MNGCVAHWYRLTELAQNPNAPAMYDYTWNNDRWESTSDYPFPLRPRGHRAERPLELPGPAAGRDVLRRADIRCRRAGVRR